MSALILDAGALVAVDRGDRATIARLRAAQQHGVELRTNAMVVAQVWRDRLGLEVSLARLLQVTDVRAVGQQDGREAGSRSTVDKAGGRHCAAAGTALIPSTATRPWALARPRTNRRTSPSSARTHRLCGPSAGTRCAGDDRSRLCLPIAHRSMPDAARHRAGCARAPTSPAGSGSSGWVLLFSPALFPVRVIPSGRERRIALQSRDPSVPRRELPQRKVHGVLLSSRAGQPHGLGQGVLVEVYLRQSHRAMISRCSGLSRPSPCVRLGARRRCAGA